MSSKVLTKVLTKVFEILLILQSFCILLLVILLVIFNTEFYNKTRLSFVSIVYQLMKFDMIRFFLFGYVAVSALKCFETIWSRILSCVSAGLVEVSSQIKFIIASFQSDHHHIYKANMRAYA